MLLLSLFGLAALVLAAIGIYGLLSHTVAERTHEIGVRMALGARAKDVLRLFVGQGLRLTAIGLVLGMVGAVALARVMESALRSELDRPGDVRRGRGDTGGGCRPRQLPTGAPGDPG